MWTRSTGLGLAAASGLESAAIRRASSQRRAGGVISRERRAWRSSNPGTRQPGAADISRDRRAWGLVASGLAALAAIPPNSHADLTKAKAGWRAATSMLRDKQTGNKTKDFRKTQKCTEKSKLNNSTSHPVCDVCVRVLWLTLHSHGASASTLDGGRVWSVVLTRRHSYNNQSHTSLVLHERDWVIAWGDLIGWRLLWRLKSCVSTSLQTRPPSSIDADAPCECSVSQSARTHTSHTGCDVELFNLDFSVHVLFPSYRDSDLYLPLYDWQTRTGDDLKTSKLDLLKKKRHLHLGCPWGKLIDTKF